MQQNLGEDDVRNDEEDNRKMAQRRIKNDVKKKKMRQMERREYN